MGEILWHEAPVDADLVISVPDSGNPAATGYARASGLPKDDGLIKNRYVARTFIQPGPGAAQARPADEVQPAARDRRRASGSSSSTTRSSAATRPGRSSGCCATPGAKRGAPADLGAADPPSLPLRRRHVDPRGDGRPRPHRRGDRRRNRCRLARLPLARGRLRGGRHARARPIATLASPATTRSATTATQTASSRSRGCPSCRARPAGCRRRGARSPPPGLDPRCAGTTHRGAAQPLRPLRVPAGAAARRSRRPSPAATCSW